jgi:endonuclease III
MSVLTNDTIPAAGDRVLAFHPTARAWRPATVMSVALPDSVRVGFSFYAQSEQVGTTFTSDHVVRWPEEVEPLDAPADFLTPPGESDAAQTWRAVLFSLTLADPRIYGERRAAKNLDPAFDPREVYALLVAAMLDADARIPGGAALFVRLRSQCADFEPRAMASLTEKEIEAARRVMPSPLRARVLFSNARIFVELDSQPGGFRGWLDAAKDPVDALTGAFSRLEPRAAVLFLRYLGSGAIAPDEALRRVATRLGWVATGATADDVRIAYESLARTVADAPALVDLTVRRFADAVCKAEPDCMRCAIPRCPARRAEPAVDLPE